ncbi:AraC family ligand binding domain-containing protein, partial [Leptolyngbya sp. FACHB-36]|uniref:AraC family ligand binding domain-containing protein n=1 Tax=Leptolyngbya sp. FACHB-36 TaxID=2692808 RepID=UPI001680B1F3|nr:AraC family ligand binding domain-containing protein [Leptolyngbya sp. FACHB-36]
MKNQIGEQAKFWRDSSLSNLELLRATYITHSFARHTHETFAIGVVDAGVEEFTYQGALHQAPADSIVIVHPGEVHTGQAGIPTGWTYRMFYPDVSLLQSAVGELSDRSRVIPYFPQPVIDDRNLANQLRHLHHALETSDSRLERESCWLWTVAQLVNRYAENRPMFRAIRQEQRVIQQVQD